MLFRLSSVVLVFTLVVLGTPAKRDGETVVSDMEDLATKLAKLDNSIEAFPTSGTSFAAAWDVRIAAQELSSAIQSTTEDVKASPALTEAQSASIAQLVKDYAPLAEQTCDDIIAKKANLDSMGLGSVVESDLKDIDTKGEALEAALQSKVTADQAATIRQQFNEVRGALTEAIDAYES